MEGICRIVFKVTLSQQKQRVQKHFKCIFLYELIDCKSVEWNSLIFHVTSLYCELESMIKTLK